MRLQDLRGSKPHRCGAKPHRFLQVLRIAQLLRGIQPHRCGAKPHRFLQALRIALLLRGVQPHRFLQALRFAQLLRGCGTWPSLPHRCGAALWSLGRGASALPCCCGFPPSEVAAAPPSGSCRFRHGGLEQMLQETRFLFIYTYFFASARSMLCAEPSFLVH